MTEQEAIEVIKRVYNVSCPDYEDEMLYEKAIELAIKALEKQIPQTLFENKFNKMHIGDTVNGICPVCFTDFVCITPKYYKEEGYGYCKQCGQKLDWGEEE